MTKTIDNKRISKKNAAIIGVSKDVQKIIKYVAIALVLFFAIVSMRAYAATLQYKNNMISDENEYLQAEIDSMKSQLVEETKVTSIEKIATKKYGMVYPTADNCITIKEKKGSKKENLSAKIRKRAYN